MECEDARRIFGLSKNDASVMERYISLMHVIHCKSCFAWTIEHPQEEESNKFPKVVILDNNPFSIASYLEEQEQINSRRAQATRRELPVK